jgi:hypothetical protein
MASAGARLLLATLITCSACSFGRQENAAKLLSYEIAPKTDRTPILAESIITLNSFNFVVEFADARRDYEALRTNWRTSFETYTSENGEVKIEVRDRAVLHLSPRGIQSDRSTTAVASTLEFEMQTKFEKKEKWVSVTPSQSFQEEYKTIVHALQTRLHSRGYIFN